MFTYIQNQDAATGDASKNDFVVPVSHSLDFFPLPNKSKVDVMLSGHTHGGQITLFGLWAPIIHPKYGNKYIAWIIHDNNTIMVVSNGIGTIKVPMRFFARPQIIVIKLKRNKKTS